MYNHLRGVTSDSPNICLAQQYQSRGIFSRIIRSQGIILLITQYHKKSSYRMINSYMLYTACNSLLSIHKCGYSLKHVQCGLCMCMYTVNITSMPRTVDVTSTCTVDVTCVCMYSGCYMYSHARPSCLSYIDTPLLSMLSAVH